jgi:broad specificity phosphatase PhoE
LPARDRDDNLFTVARVYVVQHAEKAPEAGDPPLTDLGRRQATRTGAWLSSLGAGAVYSSPLLRARQTAHHISVALGDLAVSVDDRLRERMNWDGALPLDQFLDDWTRATADRDFVPRAGDSSHQAARRMLSFLREHAAGPSPIAVVTHGGITVDALRTLLGDDAVPAALMRRGGPACAITTVDAGTVIDIARIDHLTDDADPSRATITT